jgi:fumarate reductase flavoprotein subunit
MDLIRPFPDQGCDVACDVSCDVLVVGAGAAGLVAALRAQEAGASVIVLERDAAPSGSTGLSAGLIPAAGTRIQKAAGLEDSPERFAADILAKSGHQADPRQVAALVDSVAKAIDWLAAEHGLGFTVIDNFTYPGHSAFRMHGLPERSGIALVDALARRVEAAGIDLICSARATSLLRAPDGRIAGCEVIRPDGQCDIIGAGAVVLACNGYGGNRALVSRHIPALAGALYFGHAGNQGEAVLWGEALGAQLRHLSGHQGHGSVAHPHGILITWATMTQGGFQVNLEGRRFSDESHGYSEQAGPVLAQPGGIVWSVFDARIADIAGQFEDFRQARAQGALVTAGDVPTLATATRLPAAELEATFAAIAALKEQGGTDGFGRNWAGAAQLHPPYCAVKVTGALFHTQGGLAVDNRGAVLRPDGSEIPGLYAAGGAACGVSGPEPSGYLSGNGLLSAIGYGYLSGRCAARDVVEFARKIDSGKPAWLSGG